MTEFHPWKTPNTVLNYIRLLLLRHAFNSKSVRCQRLSAARKIACFLNYLIRQTTYDPSSILTTHLHVFVPRKPHVTTTFGANGIMTTCIRKGRRGVICLKTVCSKKKYFFFRKSWKPLIYSYFYWTSVVTWILRKFFCFLQNMRVMISRSVVSCFPVQILWIFIVSHKCFPFDSRITDRTDRTIYVFYGIHRTNPQDACSIRFVG